MRLAFSSYRRVSGWGRYSLIGLATAIFHTLQNGNRLAAYGDFALADVEPLCTRLLRMMRAAAVHTYLTRGLEALDHIAWTGWRSIISSVHEGDGKDPCATLWGKRGAEQREPGFYTLSGSCRPGGAHGKKRPRRTVRGNVEASFSGRIV